MWLTTNWFAPKPERRHSAPCGHRCHTQRADEFVFQVRRADEEPLLWRADPLQPTGVVGVLRLVAQPREAEPQAGWPEEAGEAADAHRTAHRQDADPFGRQVPATARGPGPP